MRTLLIVGLGLSLGGCNCGPVAVADAGFDAGVDAGVDAGFDAGVYVDAGPSRVAYKITSVTGTYTGDGVNVMTGPARTDTLAVNTCNYMGGTDAGLLIGIDGGTPMIQVTGTAMCPAGMATSTGMPATCTATATTAPAALFQGTIEMAGWADDSVVTFKIAAPPSGMPGCNNASVVVAAAQPWGIQATTTAYMFKALQPFQVRFKGPSDGGTRTLVSGTNTSNVSWDLTMTVDPKLP